MCKINDACKIEIELCQRFHTEPISQWKKRINKEDIFVIKMNEALQKLMRQALDKCSEIRIPTILVNHEIPQETYVEYDEFGEGVGDSIGVEGEFRLGFYLSILGTKR